jgi:PIN domain nuclease of toxin-antitoxin system
MILLDTHIWIWWVDDNEAKLSPRHRELIQQYQAGGLGASIIPVEKLQRLLKSKNLVYLAGFMSG